MNNTAIIMCPECGNSIFISITHITNDIDAYCSYCHHKVIMKNLDKEKILKQLI